MEGKSSVRDFFNSCIREGPNSRCADCGASEPQWASANLGIFVCISCSGAHRTLGTHISRVRSLFLDTWQEEELKIMRELGNAKGNAIWEANLPPFYVRPTPEDSNLFKEQFIKAKYERKEFVDGSLKGLDASSMPSKDGYLVKKGEVVKNWKKRWFVLHGSLLCYFKKPPGKDDPPAGEVLLSEASYCDATNDLSVLDNHHNCFEIKTPLRNYYISAESPRVMFEWIQAIRQARYRLAKGIAIPNSPRPEDLKPEEVLETLRKSSTLLHRKHQIDKKAFRDCFLGVELTDAIMVHWKLGKREEACQVAQKVFATGQILSLNGPAELVDGRFCYQLKKP